MQWKKRCVLSVGGLLGIAVFGLCGRLQAAEGEEAAPGPKGLYANRAKFGAIAAGADGAEGASAQGEAAVIAGLDWLAKAQEKDGHWDCKRWGGAADYDIGVSGLALLAFHGAGYTQRTGKFKTNIEDGVKWLCDQQREDGAYRWKTFYEQGIATMAICEAFGLTQDPALGATAQKAVDYIVATQPDHGGFRYAGAVAKDEGDLSVSSWQFMALKSALASGLKVPDQAIERSKVLLKNTLREFGGSAYTVGTPNASPSMTAAGMLARQFLGGDDAEILAAANWLHQHQRKDPQVGPGTGKDHLVGDLYYTYYSTLAMFQMGGQQWIEWNRSFRDPLIKCQCQQEADAEGRFIRGSWDPANHQWAQQGGRVFATAMAAICLEVYYRYCPVYRVQKPTAF